MVLANTNTAGVDSIMRMPPDEALPGLSEEDARMRALAEAISQMEEGEQEFHKIRSQENGVNGNEPLSIPNGTPRTTRPCSLLRSPHNRTVISNNVTFSQKHSAMSVSYSSPRQYTLSASTVKRSASGMLNHIRQRTASNLRLRSLHSSSTQSFDYDEYEEVPLEMVKSYKAPFHYVIETEDIYTRACSYLRITASQTYVKQVTTTRTVMMANTSLSHLTIKPVAISLVRDHRIHTLDVSGNDIGGLGVMYIAEMMAVNDTITDLNLSNTNPGRVGLEVLARKLSSNKSLNVLRLESNSLDHTETDILVEIIKSLPNLIELFLGHNNLGYEGATLLAEELETNTTLRTLDLQWNHFRKQSAFKLCTAIKSNQGLVRLNLSWNGLGKEGCAALAKSLPNNENLKHLDLTNNRIDIIALPFLLHGLVRNTGIETLELAKNPMTTEGVKAVIRAINGAENMRLKYLNIEDIPVDKAFTELVESLKKKRPINVDHGAEMYSAVEMTMHEHDPNDLNRFDPVMVIVEYMRIDNLRLIDLFQFFDTSGRGLVSKDHLRAGIATIGLPLTEYHLDCIMKDVDKKRDGYIDLEEFMNAQRDMSKVIIQRTTKAKKKGKEDLGLKELRKILKDLVEKRNKKNKEKAMNKMNSAAASALTKVKVATALLKAKDEATEADATETTDTPQASVKVLANTYPGLARRGSIEREQAFILAGTSDTSSDKSRLRRRSVSTFETATSESENVKLPKLTEATSVPEVWTDGMREDASRVDEFLTNQLRSDSTIDMAIHGEPIGEEDSDDVDKFSDETYR